MKGAASDSKWHGGVSFDPDGALVYYTARLVEELQVGETILAASLGSFFLITTHDVYLLIHSSAVVNKKRASQCSRASSTLHSRAS